MGYLTCQATPSRRHFPAREGVQDRRGNVPVSLVLFGSALIVLDSPAHCVQGDPARCEARRLSHLLRFLILWA